MFSTCLEMDYISLINQKFKWMLWFIQVVATDAGKPEFVSTATVTIRVIDINDNFPVFDKNDYNLFVPEHSENGTHLKTITVCVSCSLRLGLVPVWALVPVWIPIDLG